MPRRFNSPLSLLRSRSLSLSLALWSGAYPLYVSLSHKLPSLSLCVCIAMSPVTVSNLSRGGGGGEDLNTIIART